MTTGDVVYIHSLKFCQEPGFDLGSTAGESCVLTARLHMLYSHDYLNINWKHCFILPLNDYIFCFLTYLKIRVMKQAFAITDHI